MEHEVEREPDEKAEHLEMTGQDTDVGDAFFDSEEDDAPVDMEVVFEAMKHVPLPDFDYADRDDNSPAAVTERLAAEAIASQSSEPATRKALTKGSSETGEAAQVKKKGANRGRPLKRMKLDALATDVKEKNLLKMPVKGVGSTFATAAKVAAEVAPNVVTGGIVAETGPRPDFSLWTVEDDLLLKNAMEAGAAVEALAKGAMRFSHKFTVRELRERWRALLYDPEISAEAAARMVEAEAALINLPPKSRGSIERHAKHLERKRRLNSIRSLYYKKRRSMAEEKLMSTIEPQIQEDGVNREAGEMHEVGEGRSGLIPLDIMALGHVDPGLLGGLSFPKEGITDFEDRAFSQMVSLLAAGGVGAVIGALPGNLTAENGEEDQKAGQEGQIRFESGENKPTDMQDTGVSSSIPEIEGIVHSDPHPAEKDVTIEGLNVPVQSNPEEATDVLQPSTTPSLKEGEIKEKQCAMQRSADKDVSQEKGGREEAGHVTAVEGKEQNSGGLIVSEIPDEASTVPPVLKVVPDSSPGEAVRDTDLRPTSIEGEDVLVREEDASSKITLTTISSEAKTELLVEEQGAVGADKLDVTAKKVDGGRALRIEGLRVEVPECHEVPENNDWLESELRDVDEGEEEEDALDVHWKYGNLRDDKDLEGREHVSFTDYEGDNEVYLDVKELEDKQGEFDEDVGNDLVYASDIPEALLHQDLLGPDLDDDDFANVEHISDILMDPILGPIVCTLSTEDTEVPNLDEALLLPLVDESPLYYASEGDVREDEFLDCTSPDDEADLPGSPSEFHVYEEMESPDMLGDQVGGVRIENDAWNQGATAGNQGNTAGRALFQTSIQSPLAGNSSPCLVYGGQPTGDDGAALANIDGEQQSHGAQAWRAPPNAFGKASSLPHHPHEQIVPGDGDVDCYQTEFDPVTGQDIMVQLDQDIGELRSDGEASPIEIEEEEPESEAEMARFSDVETMIMDMDLDPGVDDEFSALEESRRMYRQQRRVLVRLEQGISAAMQRSLTKRKALAILYGRHLRYYMTKTEVSMGRMTQDNIVDIDLGKEGRANKVSRQQAYLKLKEDGMFYLRNLGRRSLTVNNIEVDTDQRAILGSNCLIEVGGMRFIFEINKSLVKQHLEGMHRRS